GITAFLAMVRKDFLLFFSDRRSVIVAFAVPILIGSFIGSITRGSGRNDGRPKTNVALTDEDGSPISKAIVANAAADSGFPVAVVAANDAKDRVRKCSDAVAVIIPAGFGEASIKALRQRDSTKPHL